MSRSKSMSRWTAGDVPSQAGKRALITGANSGVGFHAARHLAEAGCAVILGCRDMRKAEEARHRILRGTTTCNVEIAALDLASLQSIHDFADSFLAAGRPLDLLINNAGVMALPNRQATADGFEMQFGTNHLGHFALTGRLLPAVLAAPSGRVVTVSSIAHRGGKIHLDDLNWTKEYKPFPAYRQSKLANLLFGFELQRRLEREGTNAISVVVHPGVSNTPLFAKGPGSAPGLRNWLVPRLIPLFAQSEDQGSLPTLYGATSPDAVGGRFYGPDGFRQVRGYPVEVTPEAQANDPVLAAKLWAASEELTSVHYTALPRS